MSLSDKLMKNSTIGLTARIVDSSVFGQKETSTTSVPMINVALSGKLDGGLAPGLIQLCGP